MNLFLLYIPELFSFRDREGTEIAFSLSLSLFFFFFRRRVRSLNANVFNSTAAPIVVGWKT